LVTRKDEHEQRRFAPVSQNCYDCGHTASRRSQLRVLVWILLAFCLMIDSAVGDLIVSGRTASCTIHFHLDDQGAFVLEPEPPLSTTDDTLVAGFLVVQAGLCVALIRLRNPKEILDLNLRAR